MTNPTPSDSSLAGQTTHTAPAELLPCPFCAGKARKNNLYGPFATEHPGAYFIVCSKCLVNTATGSTKEVVKIWNTRHRPTVQEPEVYNNPPESLQSAQPTPWQAAIAAREALESIVNGTCQKAVPNSKCEHGTWSWETCESCIDAVAIPALTRLNAAIGDDNAGR